MSLQNLTFLETDRAMPLMRLPLRTTVVQLDDGARVLIAPASTFSSELLRGAGAVTDIVVPNLLHTEGMRAASIAHPRARLWGPVGAAQKHPALHWGGVLGGDPWPYERELPLVPLAGMPTVNECVFVHPASRSLLVTDLVFNIEHPQGLRAWLVLELLFGAWKKLATPRLLVRMTRDRAALRSSLARVTEHPFDHLVPAHGSVVRRDGNARLLAALRERRLAE